MKLSSSITPVSSGSFTGRLFPAMGFWLALATVVMIGGPSQADDLEDITAASDSLQKVVRKALVDEDGSLLASIFTQDGAVISPDGRVVRGHMTLKTSAALLFMTMGGGKIELSRHSLCLIDSTAYETGRFVFRRSGDETNQVWQGAYTAIWQREAGQWKVSRALGLQ